MAKLIEPAMEVSTHRPLQVTAISQSANSHAPAAGQIDTSPERATLDTCTNGSVGPSAPKPGLPSPTRIPR